MRSESSGRVLIPSPSFSAAKPFQASGGNDSKLLIVFYVQIMPDDLVMQLHRF
ncbi:aldehyde dehydrogenase [Klebsiella quasipneumoniae]|nr:aldehyde dehydrogenase [Klebsiella quasipneumoniae]